MNALTNRTAAAIAGTEPQSKARISSRDAIRAGMTYAQWLETLPDDSWKRQYASQIQGQHWFEAQERSMAFGLSKHGSL